MRHLEKFTFSIGECVRELASFEEMLAKNAELKEAQHILPFFKSNKNLAAYIGSYLPTLNRFDRMNSEFTFFGDFRADLIVADSASFAHCLIEFEDATAKSIFETNGRSTSDWGKRFEHGYSQIIDWLWKIDDMRQTSQARAIFGDNGFDFMGMLIIGRDQFLSPVEILRLNWRANKVTVNSQKIVCLTYDQLASGLKNGLAMYQAK